MATVSENTVGIKLAVTGASAMANHFRQSAVAMERFNTQIQRGVSALARWGVAMVSLQTLSRFYSAAQESAVAVAQLSRALASTGQVANATTVEFIEQAQALQRLTGVSDEAVLAVQRTLLSFGAQADTVKELTPLVLDLAAAMGTDAVNAAKLVGRALDGEVIQLDRLNIRAKNTTELMQKMRAAFGGQAAAEFGARGGLARLAVSLGEFEETMGRLMMSGSDQFWARLADGIDRVSGAMDRFSATNTGTTRLFGQLADWAGQLSNINFTRIALLIEMLSFALQEIDALLGIEQKMKETETPGAAGAGAGPELATLSEMLAVERDRLAIKQRFADNDVERIDYLDQQLAIVREMEEIKRRELSLGMVDGEMTKTGLETAKAINDLTSQRLGIEKEILQIEAERAAERRRQFESTFPGGTQARFDEFRERSALEAQMGGGRLGIVAGIQEAMIQLGTSAQIVGRAMTTFIGGAGDSIAGGNKGLLTMTMTWGQALKSIAGGILNSVIDAISRMFAEWIVGRLLVSTVEKTAAAGELAAKAPVALMDSITSFGVAAAVGIAALLAAMAALGSFESGGYTGAGPRQAPAGVVHRGEYVVPAGTVQSLGLDWFEAAAAGMLPSAANQAPSTGPRALNQKLNVFLDRRAWIAASRDDIEAIAIDAMSRAGWRTAGA